MGFMIKLVDLGVALSVFNHRERTHNWKKVLRKCPIDYNLFLKSINEKNRDESIGQPSKIISEMRLALSEHSMEICKFFFNDFFAKIPSN